VQSLSGSYYQSAGKLARKQVLAEELRLDVVPNSLASRKSRYLHSRIISNSPKIIGGRPALFAAELTEERAVAGS